MAVDSSTFPSLEAATCPFDLYAQFRDGPAAYELPGREGTFVVSRREDVHYVLRHHELFSNHHPGFKAARASGAGEHVANAIHVDPPQHGPQRKLIGAPLTPRLLQNFVPMIEEVADQLIDAFIDEGRCEFVTAFAEPLPIHVTCRIMGLSLDDYPKFSQWGKVEGRAIPYLPVEQQPAQFEQGAELGHYLREVMASKYEQPGDDALSEIIRAQVARDGEFRLDYMTSEACLLVAGGVVTTGHMLGSALGLLLQHPDQLAKVRADHSLIRPMLEETIRLESPVQFQPRMAKVDTQIGDVSIPEGSTILVVFAAANRDEQVFSNADEFDVERANLPDHMGFGYGTHFCLGAPLARMEGTVAFEALFGRLADIRLASGAEIDPISSVSFRGPKALDIEFEAA